VPDKILPEVLLKAGIAPDKIAQYNNLKKGEGCEECSGMGLKGRMAIFECMRFGSLVKEAIYRGASPLEIKRQAIADGMRTMRQAALLKLKAGQTTLEEVLTSTIADDL
jgi:type II secretory ATPase GspE/PulE/Tfp pilus assembly ATPase PilB-like protein